MARVPYLDEAARPDLKPLIDRIKAERGGRLFNLYKILLHSPTVAEGWLHLFTAIRQRSTLPGRYRELAILEIALLNGADYEYTQHIPFALKEGITREQIADLKDWRSSQRFDAADRAVMAYAGSMTREIHVPDEVFAQVRACFADRELVELTATIAGYNLVSRFLEAMAIDPE